MLLLEEFDVTNPPPEGDDTVAKWAWTVYELSRRWRDEELHMPEIWRANYKLFHGNHWGGRKKRNDTTINLFYANIERTVANITSRNPVAEVVDLDGTGGDQAKMGTTRMAKWWLDTNQKAKLRATTLNSEIYGITWEKSVWLARFKQPGVVVADPFSVFPYPGYWENVATDCPAICHAMPLNPRVVERTFELEKDSVEHTETYDLLGADRQEIIGQTATYGSNRNTVGHQGANVTRPIAHSTEGAKGVKALVVEVWCRDLTQISDGDGGKVSKYPGGIRCITVCNEGNKLLADKKNPSLNHALSKEKLKVNHLYKRFPFYKNNSYLDTSSIFGFSAAEQTAPLVLKIDELMSRLVNYAMRSMTGILVIPPKSGITRAHLNNKPNLVLWPQTHEAAAGIRIVSFPNPPQIIEAILDKLIALHDRIHAIQDVDRGDTPKNITAAAAIVALQERNAVLIQHKIDGIDYLVQERGNYAVAQWQNHGHDPESIKNSEDEIVEFRGVDLAGLKFNYTVEAGSSMPKTSLQIQEQATALFKEGAIDQQALLENVNFPGWRKIVERMNEEQLEAALQILIGSGLPEETAAELLQLLRQDQGGPGDNQIPPEKGSENVDARAPYKQAA